MNMSYCKFENTVRAVRQCLRDWDTCESDYEVSAKKELIELCKEIAEDEA